MTPQNLNTVLGELNGIVQLGVIVGDKLVPVISGIVKKVEGASSADSEDYTIVLSVGNANLDDAHQQFTDGLAEINAERAKADPPLPPIVVTE